MSTNHTYTHQHTRTIVTIIHTYNTSTCAAADEFERRCRRLAGRAQTDWNAGQPNAGRPTWFSSGMCVLTAFCPGYGSFLSVCLSLSKKTTPTNPALSFDCVPKWCCFVFLFSNFGFYFHLLILSHLQDHPVPPLENPFYTSLNTRLEYFHGLVFFSWKSVPIWNDCI